MAQENALLYAFNRGIISPFGLARTDLKVQALSAEIQTNWMPRELGSMMLRPGTQYIDTTYNNAKAVHIPFMKALTDTAIIELTNQTMRVRVNEAIITRPSVTTAVTNGNFTSNINSWTGADESGAVSQWVSGQGMSLTGTQGGSRAIRSQAVSLGSGDSGILHALRIVITKGYVTLRVGTALGDDSYINKILLSTGTYSLAFVPTGTFTIEFTANETYASYVASVNIESSGPMTLPTPWLLADLPNVRYDQSEDEIFLACAGGYAQYKIERIGNAYSWGVLLYLADDGPFELINTDLSTTMEVAALTGDTTLTSSNPFFESGHVGALFQLTSQSQNTNDVIAGSNQATNFIEVTDVGTNRQFSFQITGTWVGTIYLERSVGAPGTWVSVASYTSNQNTTYLDGLDNQIIYYRFNFENSYSSGSATVSMQYANGGITGICRVTGFSSNTSVDVEVLKPFGAASIGNATAGGHILFSVNPSNGDTITLNGITWTFKTSGATGNQTNIQGSLVATLAQLASDVSASANGSLTVANYAATATQLNITYKTVGTAGNAYTLAASAATPSGATLTGGSSGSAGTATSLWAQGTWSNVNGFPSAVAFYEGRLWWVGNDAIDGSISDAFASYDDTVVGDSGPIDRTIGSGPVENVCWLLGLQRLLLGGENREFSIRSSYLDEPLTPTDFNIKSPSTRGSCKVAALQIDTNLVFVQRGDVDTGSNQYGPRLIEMSYQGNYAIVDYASKDLSQFAPELVAIGISKIAVQRKIDTRIHCILTDGTVAICIYDPIENMKCWILYQTAGTVEDIIVMPGGVEDKVYYVVNRTIEGSTVRYFERWALESECVGGTLNKNIDCHTVIQNGSPSTTISVPQLAGQNVAIWADGIDIGTQADGTQLYTLDGSGNATVPSYTNAVVGLAYTGQFQSAKLAYAAAQNGTALTQSKSVDRLGLILANTHAQGLQYGPDFSHLDNLPGVEDGNIVPPNQIWSAYDKESFEFNGNWDTDSRMCLQAQAPRPCNVLAAVISITTTERV